jgi:tetratricopeptide (TPR) repeat protein
MLKFGILWYIIGIFPLYSPMISFRNEIGRTMQDNWIYFSSIGLFLPFSIVLNTIAQYCRRKLYLIFLIVVCLFFTTITLKHNTYYKDPIKHNNYLLKVLPNSPFIPWNYLADHYFEQKNIKKALYYYKKVIKHSNKNTSNLAKVYRRIAVILYQQKKYDEAILYLKHAYQINPLNAKTTYYLGITYAAKQEKQKAINMLSSSISSDFFQPDAHKYLAKFLTETGDKNLATIEYSIYNYLRSIKDTRKSRQELQKQLKTLIDFLFHKGLLSYKTNDITTAKYCFNSILNLDFKNKIAHYMLGHIYIKINNSSKAQEHFKKSGDFKDIPIKELMSDL